MTPRPAYRKLLTQPHAYNPDTDTGACKWRSPEGRPCGLPETNRHHNTKPTTQPAQDDTQLRLDMNG
jgi:hypothetical protein